MPSFHGITAQTLEARPNFSVSRDTDGKYTGSASFTIKKGAWAGLRDNFVKGNGIRGPFPDLEVVWDFLLIDQVELRDEPGGLTVVTCSLIGFLEDDAEETFSMEAVLIERPIQEHPLFIAQVMNTSDQQVLEERDVLLGGIDGSWIDYTFLPNADKKAGEVKAEKVSGFVAEETATLESKVCKKWWKTIVQAKIRSYLAPTVEWTKETVNSGGLSNSEINKIGQIDEPPGNPPLPDEGEYEWLKVSASDTRNDAATTTVERWRLSPPGGFFRFPKDNNKPTTLKDDGIYKFNRDALDAN